jgi:hypothetical protein
VDDRRDFVEWEGEHVVQHEREPLARGQRLEYNEKCEANRVGDERLLLRREAVVDRDDRFRQPRAHVFLPLRAARAEHVEGDPGDDRRQPAAEIVDRSVVFVEADPCLLYGVLALAERAEHAVGHRLQAGTLLFELLCEPVTGHVSSLEMT